MANLLCWIIKKTEVRTSHAIIVQMKEHTKPLLVCYRQDTSGNCFLKGMYMYHSIPWRELL